MEKLCKEILTLILTMRYYARLPPKKEFLIKGKHEIRVFSIFGTI